MSRDPRRRERRFVGRKLLPGQPGTKRLLAEYGERLLCVRYRYDAERGVCLTTAELIVAERPWKQPLPPRTVVGLRIPWGSFSLRRLVRAEGAWWDIERQVWLLEWQAVQRLKLRPFVDPNTLPKALLGRLPKTFLRSLGSRSKDTASVDTYSARTPSHQPEQRLPEQRQLDQRQSDQRQSDQRPARPRPSVNPDPENSSRMGPRAKGRR